MSAPLRPNAHLEQSVVDFVGRFPGTSINGVVLALFHRIAGGDESPRRKSKYKQAAGAVERTIKDRHVRVAGDNLYPWDQRRKSFAEALERATFAAPTPPQKRAIGELACRAWRDAGDENAARILERLLAKREGEDQALRHDVAMGDPSSLSTPGG